MIEVALGDVGRVTASVLTVVPEIRALYSISMLRSVGADGDPKLSAGPGKHGLAFASRVWGWGADCVLGRQSDPWSPLASESTRYAPRQQETLS